MRRASIRSLSTKEIACWVEGAEVAEGEAEGLVVCAPARMLVVNKMVKAFKSAYRMFPVSGANSPGSRVGVGEPKKVYRAQALNDPRRSFQFPLQRLGNCVQPNRAS